MSRVLTYARALPRSSHFHKLWRHASVSVIVTSLSLVVLFLTYHVWKLGSAMECNVLAVALSAVVSFQVNRRWVWQRSGRSRVAREVAPFWIIAAISLVISTAVVGAVAHNAGLVTHSSLDKAYLVEFANLFTYGCLWVIKYILYDRLLFPNDDEEPAGFGAVLSSGPAGDTLAGDGEGLRELAEGFGEWLPGTLSAGQPAVARDTQFPEARVS